MFEEAAELGEIFFDAVEGCVEVGIGLLKVGEGVEFLHGGDDDADEEVEDGEGGDHDEGNEEGPGPGVDFHDGADDAHGPGFEGHDLEQRVEAFANGAEPGGKVGSEKVGGEDGGGEEEDGHDGDDAGETGDGVEEGGHYATELRDDGEEAEDAKDAQGAEDGPGPGGGDEGDSDDEEVEDVPAAAPEEPAEGDEFDGELGDEDGEAEFVEGFEDGPPGGHDAGVGFEAEDGGVEEDDGDDGGLDAGGFDPVTELATPRGGFLSVEHTKEILVGKHGRRLAWLGTWRTGKWWKRGLARVGWIDPTLGEV